MGGEHTFLSERGCLVTNARFTYGGETFAMANVTSVRGVQSPITWVVIFAALAVLCMIAGAGMMFFIFTVLAVVAHLMRQAYVVLHTAGSERRALASRDAAFVSRVVGR